MYSNGGAGSFTREARNEKEAEKRLFFMAPEQEGQKRREKEGVKKSELLPHHSGSLPEHIKIHYLSQARHRHHIEKCNPHRFPNNEI